MCRDGKGRVGLCAEFAMCRVDPAPFVSLFTLTHVRTCLTPVSGLT